MSVHMQEQQVDPERAFERYIETDPSICNQCFRRPSPEQTDGTDVESKGRYELGGTYSALYHWTPEDFCPDCGAKGLLARDETLSIEAASHRAIRLSVRLHERQLAHDWRLLVWFVRQAKRTDGIHTKDRDIAARAVEFALNSR